MLSSAENMNSKEYSLTRFSEDSLADVEQLYAAVYGHRPPPHFFKRKYDTAYTGVSYIGYIAWNREQQAIAFYGVSPCFLQYDDKAILAAQSTDTMTHPAYRFKGMFAELSRHTFALCMDAGIQLLFGFPNQNSYPGAIRMGWKETETMDCFIIPVSTLPLAQLAKNWTVYKKYKSMLLSKYLSSQSGVANSAVSAGFAGILREEAYLQYKKYSSTQVIQVGMSRLWIKINNSLIIGDMEQVDETNFDNIMHVVKKIAARLGIRKIIFQTSPNTPLHRLFQARYTSFSSFPVLFYDLGIVGTQLEKIKFSFSDIDIF